MKTKHKALGIIATTLFMTQFSFTSVFANDNAENYNPIFSLKEIE